MGARTPVANGGRYAAGCGQRHRPQPAVPAARLPTRRHGRQTRRPAPRPPHRHGPLGGDTRAAACLRHLSPTVGTDASGASGAPATTATGTPQVPCGGAPGGGSHRSPHSPRRSTGPATAGAPARTVVAAWVPRRPCPFPLTASPLPRRGPLRKPRVHGRRRGCHRCPGGATGPRRPGVWVAVAAGRRGGIKGAHAGSSAAAAVTA